MGLGGQGHAPAALPPGMTRYPLSRRLGALQGRSGRVRNILSPTRIRSPDHPARSELLYRLRYPGPCVCVCVCVCIYICVYTYISQTQTHRHTKFPEISMQKLILYQA